MADMDRRRFFSAAAVPGAAAGLTTVFGSRMARPTLATKGSARSFRFVQFGDTHFGAPATLPLAASPEGYPKAMRQVQAMDDPPDFILHTGDIITDAFWATPESALEQWTLYRQIMQKHCQIPIRYTLGNHDVNFDWGWGDETTRYPGKGLALEQLGLEAPYYSFDHKGWHFIVLDNTQRGGYNGFTHHLDEQQYTWLERDLAATRGSMPTVISSHAPILTVTCFFCPSNKQHPDGLVIPNDWVHTDVERLHKLFRQYPNVKLCLSGHFHAVDHVQYLGIHHICGGAVCADYWRHPLPYAPEHEAGYGVVDLFQDGTFEYRYVDYGLVGYLEETPRVKFPWERARLMTSPAARPPQVW
jgi:3',5'-cyclic AMP phosphodiesterase CpdA